jgi:6-phosphogluconate dehydrogenase
MENIILQVYSPFCKEITDTRYCYNIQCTGDMQLIAEIYDILKHGAGLNNEELADTFTEWNTTELNSFLIEITATIFAKKDDEASGAQGVPSGYLLDKILDKTGMKGTGRWTIQEAAERSTPGPVMAAALDARYLSGRKKERIAASGILKGPSELPNVERSQIIEDCKHALYAAKICSYAQGMCLIKAASDEYKWNVDLSECARIWKGGCIIRAGFLDRIKGAYQRDPELANLLVDPDFAEELNKRQSSWRRIVTLCVASGIAAPALASSISYYDSYRRDYLPANLTQAQRDYFGGHSFERTDRPGAFHAMWSDAHKDIGNVNERNKGNL